MKIKYILITLLLTILFSAALNIGEFFLASNIKSPPKNSAAEHNIFYTGAFLTKERFFLDKGYEVYYWPEISRDSRVFYFLKGEENETALFGIEKSVAENLKKYDGKNVKITARKIRDLWLDKGRVTYPSLYALEIYIIYPEGKEVLVFKKTNDKMYPFKTFSRR